MAIELPEEDELVLVTIKKILPYGAFCILPEYENAEAFLHISEVAPRWIKNIHEFISEGQRHVAKVHRIDRQKNQIDISLKRVSEEEKRKKLLHTRLEKRAEKLLELTLSQVKDKMSAAEVRKRIENHFGSLYDAFQNSLEDEHALDPVDLPKGIKNQIITVARKSIKRPSVEVQKTFTLVCYSEDGIEKIKKMLTRKEKNVRVHYLGSPKYSISLTAPNYKEGEKKLSRILEDIKNLAEKNKCNIEVEND